MFWYSLKTGFHMFLYWETYVVGLVYCLISFVPLLVAGALMDSEKGKAMASGVFIFTIGRPILQIVAVVVFVMTLSPMMLGFSDDAAWLATWQTIMVAPIGCAKLLGILVLASLFTAFIPILGRLNSFYVLVIGGITLAIILGTVIRAEPDLVGDDFQLIPSFWFVIGILVVGGIASWLGLILAFLLTLPLSSFSEDLAGIVVMPLGGIFGFIPVFIYAAWLGAQITNGG